MKKILSITYFVLACSVCFSAQNYFLDPQTAENLWFTWAEKTGTTLQIFCSEWNGSAWGKSIQVSDSAYNSFSPVVTLDKDKNPWIVWAGEDGIKTSIYCRHYNGTSWSSVTQVDDVDIYNDSTPSMTIDQNNVPWIVWAGSDGKSDNIFVSRLSGNHWTTPQMVNSYNLTPDILPAINFDSQKHIIIVWCGFNGGKYKLFYSMQTNEKWQEQKPVFNDDNKLSSDLPSLIKDESGNIQLFWNECNLRYTSTWNGNLWSNPEESQITLPNNFLNKSFYGPSCITWKTVDGIIQALRVISFINLSQKGYSKTNSSKSELLAYAKDFFFPSASAEVTANKYIAFGDSITYGVGAENNYGYPPRLEAILLNKIGASTVVNEGVPGERTMHGVERVNGVLSADNAKFILILEGTNDTSWGYSTETITFNLGQMIDRAINYGTTPIIATLPPRQDTIDGRVKDDINPAIQQLAKDKNISCTDQYSKIAEDPAKFMSDYLHPNDAGYDLMAQSWSATIESILNPKPDESGGGCGAVPPIYRNSNNFPNNLLPLLFFTVIMLASKIAVRKI